jgi:hypothetical protein
VALDTDKDGQVGLYEWKAANRPVNKFQEMDFNNDGFITVEEALKYFKLHPEEAGTTAVAQGPNGGSTPMMGGPGGPGRGPGGPGRGPGGPGRGSGAGPGGPGPGPGGPGGGRGGSGGGRGNRGGGSNGGGPNGGGNSARNPWQPN